MLKVDLHLGLEVKTLQYLLVSGAFFLIESLLFKLSPLHLNVYLSKPFIRCNTKAGSRQYSAEECLCNYWLLHIKLLHTKSTKLSSTLYFHNLIINILVTNHLRLKSQIAPRPCLTSCFDKIPSSPCQGKQRSNKSSSVCSSRVVKTAYLISLQQRSFVIIP